MARAGLGVFKQVLSSCERLKWNRGQGSPELRLPGNYGSWKWLILMIQKSPYMTVAQGWRKNGTVDAEVLDDQSPEEQVEEPSWNYMSLSDAGSYTGRKGKDGWKPWLLLVGL